VQELPHGEAIKDKGPKSLRAGPWLRGENLVEMVAEVADVVVHNEL